MSSCLALRQFRRHHGDEAEFKHSLRLDKQIKKEKKQYRHTQRLLLLGAGESGKSTVVKQMRILHVDGFTREERNDMILHIRRNVRDAILTLLGAMERIRPPEHLDNEDNEWRAKCVFEMGTSDYSLEIDYPPIFYEHCKVLWNDSGVQRTFRRSKEFHLIDSAKYFLDQTDVISQMGYTPTDQDVLRCRLLTSIILETHFVVDKIQFYMFDVGGQRSERHRWIQCFSNVNAIIFLIACSDYDLTLMEDPSVNRMKESLDLFSSVWTNRWLLTVSVILFLNKEDLLREKIFAGTSKLEDYYSEFLNFKKEGKESTRRKKRGKKNSKTDEEDPNTALLEEELELAKIFIQSMFLKIAIPLPKAGKHRFCYPHFTCAVDTERMRTVFNDCKDMLQRKNLSDMVCV